MPPLHSALSERQYARIWALVRERSGLELKRLRRSDLERALLDAISASGADGLEELYGLMCAEPTSPALQALLDALVIGESHFFRSGPQFNALSARVLPELIAKRRDSRRLRIWSAGCSAGQEPYSVAILLERLLPDIDDWQLLILASDVSRSALEQARRGAYRRWSFREVAPEIERDYFIERGRERELLPRVRRRVSFASLNLADDRYPSPATNTVGMDLVLCRNVLIYFNEAASAGVLRRLGEAVCDGGWLVLGQAEAANATCEGFDARRVEGTILYQKATPSRAASSRSKEMAVLDAGL